LEKVIVKRLFVIPLLMALGGAATAVDAAEAGAVSTTEESGGSVVLSNVSPGDNQDAAPAAPDVAAAPAADEAAKDPRELYRDKVLQDGAENTSATSAASRRYRMVDRATYQTNNPGTAPATPAAPK
jgi:hypothetical protein